MPGYIIHLVEAEIVLKKIEGEGLAKDLKQWSESYRWGNIVPDLVEKKEKVHTHFWNTNYDNNHISIPDIERFITKYNYQLSHCKKYPDVFGYYSHLYLDKNFFNHYLKNYIDLFDYQNYQTQSFSNASYVKIVKSGEKISISQLFTNEYLYGDYTKLTQYLIKKYEIVLRSKIETSSVEEIHGRLSKNILNELNSIVEKATLCDCGNSELKIIEKDSLEKFLFMTAEAILKKFYYMNGQDVKNNCCSDDGS